jgi:hypothetical protein
VIDKPTRIILVVLITSTAFFSFGIVRAFATLDHKTFAKCFPSELGSVIPITLMVGNSAEGAKFIYIILAHSVRAAGWHLESLQRAKEDKERLQQRLQKSPQI